MEKIPYAHLYTDVLGVMQMLARGSNAAVYLAIGAAMPIRPAGLNEIEIVTYTGLSAQTVKAALSNLQTLGIIECQDGAYKTVRYIEYRKATLPRDESNVGKNFFPDNKNHSINRQSNLSVNPKSKMSTDEEFSLALQALARVLFSYGGLNALEMQDFAELWTDYPSPERHAAALEVMLERAAKPNYRYYAACVRNGATPKTSARKAENPERVEVTL